MIAVDTNILVRFLTDDHPTQGALVRELFRTRKIWVAKTVLLETEWVLRKLYSLEDAAIRHALARLLALPSVQAEDAPAVAHALQLAGQGLDFADALHIASRPAGATFTTFDRPLLRKAKKAAEPGLSALPIETTNPTKLPPAQPREHPRR